MGILSGILSGRGLLGLGGVQGLAGANTAQMQPLLGGMYDPQEMQRIKLKNMLLGAGLGLLNQQGSTHPIGALDGIGAGLSGGLQMAQQAGDEYRNSAMDAYKLKQGQDATAYQHEQNAYQRSQDQRNNQWQDKSRAHEQQGWDLEGKNRAAFDSMVSGLSPEEQAYARMDPNGFAKQYFDKKYNTSGSPEMFGTSVPYTNEDGTVGYSQLSKNGQPVPLAPPKGAKFMSPFDKSFESNRGKGLGASVGAAQADLPAKVSDANMINMKIDRLLGNKDLGSAVGYNSWMPDMLTSNNVIGVRGDIKELMGGAFLQARQLLKGGGAITDYEGAKAEQAYTRMDTAIKSSDPETFKSALKDFKDMINLGVAKMQSQAARGYDGTQSQPIPDPNGSEFNWTPEKGLH